MSTLMSALSADIGMFSLCVLLAAAFFTSMVHGATGIAGGFLLTVVAAPILGFKAVIPVLSITLLISHSARALLNLKQFDRNAYTGVVIPAAPCIVMAALIYGRLSNTALAWVLGTVVLLSIPFRRWANAKQLKTSKTGLYMAGAVYGGISGVSIGPGMLLMPVLMGLGMNKQAFVATLAAIALTTNVVRTSVYGLTDLLTLQTALLGVIMGLATIPGTWLGRSILRQLTDEKHATAVEWLVVLGGLNFYWLGYRQMFGLS